MASQNADKIAPMQNRNTRPPRRPSPPADPNEGRMPNVVSAYNVTPGVLATALYPYRHLPEARDELQDLAVGRAA